MGLAAESLVEMANPVSAAQSPSKVHRELMSQSGSSYCALGSAASPSRMAAASLVELRTQLLPEESPSKLRRTQMLTCSTRNSPRKRSCRESSATSSRKRLSAVGSPLRRLREQRWTRTMRPSPGKKRLRDSLAASSQELAAVKRLVGAKERRYLVSGAAHGF